MNRANWQREEPEAQRKAAAIDGTSRKTREVQVRICERLGVKLPGPTRHELPSPTRSNRQEIIRAARGYEFPEPCGVER